MILDPTPSCGNNSEAETLLPAVGKACYYTGFIIQERSSGYDKLK
jgi:hypothetical protein